MVQSMAVRSDVWEFFDKVGGSQAKYRLCSKLVAWHRGTSNLRTHLSGQHPFQYKRKDDDTSKKQPPITNCFEAVSQKPCLPIERRPSQTLLLRSYVFVNQLEATLSELQCPICQEILLNPLQTTCGHLFCKHCLLEALQREDLETARFVGRGILT